MIEIGWWGLSYPSAGDPGFGPPARDWTGGARGRQTKNSVSARVSTPSPWRAKPPSVSTQTGIGGGTFVDVSDRDAPL